MIAKERSDNLGDSGEVEQIQLHAVEPGTEIHINLPAPNSEEEVEQQARAIFETFPPGMQRALESGSLDRVNEVLGKMSLSEAEELVEQLGNAGMLSMEQGIIDGTTKEGQETLKELEREAREGKKAEEEDEEAEFDVEAALREMEMEDPEPGQVQVADVD